jgi:hypothetical protein
VIATLAVIRQVVSGGVFRINGASGDNTNGPLVSSGKTPVTVTLPEELILPENGVGGATIPSGSDVVARGRV